jgi:hypothetical protein
MEHGDRPHVCDNLAVRRSLPLVLIASLSALTASAPASAQIVNAHMHVGVSVSPACRVSAGGTAAADDGRAAVRVACGRQDFQRLRVTSRRAGGVAAVLSRPGRNVHAGAEVVFVVPELLSTVASAEPFSSTSRRPADSPPVVVTLDL